MSDPRSPHDVDALARRLARRDPGGERSQAMRHAILDAAQGHGAPVRAARGWWIGVAAAAAAGVAAWLVLRGPARPPGPAPAVAVVTSRAPVAPTGPAPTVANPPIAAPAAVAASPASAAQGSLAPTPVSGSGGAAPTRAVAGVPDGRIPDGVTAFATTSPLYVTRGDAAITAPPAARFDVEVRGDQVKRITVTEGWVVVAGAHAAATTIVPMRYTWTAPPPPPSPPAVAVPAVRSSPPAPRVADVPRSTSATRVAAAGNPAPSTEPVPGPASAPPAPLPAAAERDFRDGLRSVLAGAPAAATAALDRACRAPSATQDEGCYWAAVAWLRSGDHDRARERFGDLLARWPGSSHVGEANVALGWLLIETGDRAGARTRFAAAADDRMADVRASAIRGLAASQ